MFATVGPSPLNIIEYTMIVCGGTWKTCETICEKKQKQNRHLQDDNEPKHTGIFTDDWMTPKKIPACVKPLISTSFRCKKSFKQLNAESEEWGTFFSLVRILITVDFFCWMTTKKYIFSVSLVINHIPFYR